MNTAAHFCFLRLHDSRAPQHAAFARPKEPGSPPGFHKLRKINRLDSTEEIHRIAGGKIVEEWEHYDTYYFMRQIGAIPAAAQQAE